jgi:hypothetical protein
VANLLKRGDSLLIEAEPLATVQETIARFGVAQQIVGPRAITAALPPERAPELLKVLIHANAEVYQVTPQRTSLEHLFLELTDDGHNNHTTHDPAGQQAMPEAALAERK